MSDRKIRAWENAGLIDAATAATIRAWEAEHSRPLALWAVIGIGALAIGLGLISVVAANWDAIPGELRLAIHFGLMAAMAGSIWWKSEAMGSDRPWLREAVLFVLGMLGMTFLGHVGQVYQTSSPLWQPLALWLALFAPLLLVLGLSWLTATGLMLPLVVMVWSYAFDVSESWSGPETFEQVTRMAFSIGLPVLAAGLAAWGPRKGTREAFWRRLEQLGLAYAAALVSLVAIVSAVDSWTSGEDAGRIFTGLALGAALGLASSLLLWRAAPEAGGRAASAVLAGGALTVMIAFAISGSQTLAGIVFMLFWAGIAAAALHAGWRGVFQTAIGVIALRLVILSFELGGDLLMSGAGLIVSGVLILAIAWGAVRVSRRFAPEAAA